MQRHPGLANVRASSLERLLDIVRRLGETADLETMLHQITEAVVSVMDFGAAAINVVEGDRVRVASVVGPPEAKALLGMISPLSYWTEINQAAEPWGLLRYFSHERDQTMVDRIANWKPAAGPSATDAGAADPDVWHPNDSLFAPLIDTAGNLVGILSVDQPRSGRRPDREQQTVLELFAVQAARAIADAGTRVTADAARRTSEQRWWLTFENSPIGTVLLSPGGQLLQCNNAFCELLGYTHVELEGRLFADLTYPDDVAEDARLFEELKSGVRDRYELELRYVRSDGALVWARLTGGITRGGAGAADTIVGQIADITARKQAEATLAHRATHDPLTDLPNRASMIAQITELSARGRPAGVLYADLDRFKVVNEGLGHDAGDALLVAVADRLRAALPADALLARVGGDEFVALATDVADVESLRHVAHLMLDALREPIRLRDYEHRDYEYTASVSVGATLSTPWYQDAEKVLLDADQALLQAKRLGRARVEIYDPRQDTSATVEDLELERALREALMRGGHGLIPYFQPIIDLSDDAVVGYEALVRWMHPVRGMLDPDEFLPMAEETGLVVPLGWRMLKLSCAAARALRSPAAPRPWIAVNVSGSQLGRGQLADAVRTELAESALDPRDLHLEITETALVGAPAIAIAEIREVAAMGVAIALDDFGTGYSSLSLLRDLPVSTVKIDGSFIGPITHDRTAIAITTSVISLCRDLGITTVAEGVETERQLDSLRTMGCNLAQGYLLGSPGPAPVAQGRESDSSRSDQALGPEQ